MVTNIFKINTVSYKSIYVGLILASNFYNFYHRYFRSLIRINSLLFVKQWDSQFPKQGEIRIKVALEQIQAIKKYLFIKRYGLCYT